MLRRSDGGSSQTLSPSSTQARRASVPMETGGFPALRQSRRLSLRAECPGQEEAGPTELLFHAFTAGKVRKTRLSSCVAVPPRTHAVPGAPVSASSPRPLDLLPPATEALPRCDVGTVRRGEKPSLKGPELVSSLSFFWISGLLATSVDLHTSSDLVD